jgi:hypothetical protein
MVRALAMARFSADMLPPRARYGAWRQLVATVFEPATPAFADRKNVRAQIDSVHLGDAVRVSGGAESGASREHRDYRHRAPIRDDEYRFPEYKLDGPRAVNNDPTTAGRVP